MLPQAPIVFMLIGIGIVILMATLRGYLIGELPGSSNFFHAWRSNRQDNPVAFYTIFVLYISAGILLCVWGFLTLLGIRIQ